MKFKRLVSFLLVAIMAMGLGLSPISTIPVYAYEGNEVVPNAPVQEPEAEQDTQVQEFKDEDIEGYIGRQKEELPLDAELMLLMEEFDLFTDGDDWNFDEFFALAAILAAGGISFSTTQHMFFAINMFHDALDESSRELLRYLANNYVFVEDETVRAIRVTAEALAPIWSRANSFFGDYVSDCGG